jgi:arylformamidase
MKLLDITAPFSPALPVYNGDPSLTVEETSRIADGKRANVSRFTFGCHTGTHIDAPKHFLDDGKTIADLPPEHFAGSAVVVEIFGCPAIGAAEIDAIPGDLDGKIVLLHTDNGDAMLDSTFRTDFVHLTGEGAEALCRRGIRGIGIDYLSVDAYGSPDFAAHMALLTREKLILEGILLTDIPAGEYFLWALPLNIPGGNGFPVRAVLEKR